MLPAWMPCLTSICMPAADRHNKWAPSLLDLPTDRPLQLLTGGRDHGIGISQGAVRLPLLRLTCQPPWSTSARLIDADPSVSMEVDSLSPADMVQAATSVTKLHPNIDGVQS